MQSDPEAIEPHDWCSLRTLSLQVLYSISKSKLRSEINPEGLSALYLQWRCRTRCLEVVAGVTSHSFRYIQWQKLTKVCYNQMRSKIGTKEAQEE